MLRQLHRFRVVLAAVAWSGWSVTGQGVEEFELPPINYSATAPTDAIQALEKRLASGEVRLVGEERTILLTLLRELDVPVESQLLLFSKTSLQRDRISPENPRAVYFSDDCYVGWVPGGLIEVASIDSHLGPVFYAFDPRDASAAGSARFVRDRDCLNCHGGLFIRDIPAVLARSVLTDASGEPLLRFGSELVDYRTLFNLRWGGWYVTGTHGSLWHRGNTVVFDADRQTEPDFGDGANVTSLEGYFDTDRYPAPSSDLVALLVFEHQIAVHNALTRAAFKSRRMMDYQGNLQRELEEPVTDVPTYDSVRRVFDNRARDVVDCLLFHDEALLPSGGVTGSTTFPSLFDRRGPTTSDGRSLRELRVSDRLFEYRCSYLIYSDLFTSLPPALKRLVYAKLARALRPSDSDPRYAYLEPAERRAIVEILRETHSDLPPDWPG